MLGKPWQQKHKETGHIGPTVRKQKKKNQFRASACLFCQFYLSASPANKMLAPTVWVNLPPQPNLEMSSNSSLEVCPLSYFRSCRLKKLSIMLLDIVLSKNNFKYFAWQCSASTNVIASPSNLRARPSLYPRGTNFSLHWAAQLSMFQLNAEVWRLL